MVIIKRFYLGLLIAGLGFPTTLLATNGYFAIGYGSAALAMGGTGIANPQDAVVAATNPAGMAFVGSRIDGGLRFFEPYRTSSAINGGLGLGTFNTDSGANQYLIPGFGANYQFNRKISMGLTVIGNGGMNTRYNDNFFGLTPSAGPTLGVNMLQALMPITVTYKPKRTQSFGGSLVLGVQSFRAYGLQSFGDFGFSSDPTKLTNNGNDWAYGAGIRLGWMGKFFKKKLSLGVTGASKIYMTEWDKYAGLLAEQGDFDIPANYGVGIAFHPNDKLTFAFDVTQILYNDVTSVGNRHPNQCLGGTGVGCTGSLATLVTPVNQLGADNGMGFGWDDMTIYKLGISYDWNNKLTLMAGFNYGEQPIPDDQVLFNFLAPAVVEEHLTLGLSYKPSKKTAVTFNYIYAFENDVTCTAGDFLTDGADSGCNTLFTGPGAASGGGSDPGVASTEMYQHSFGIDYTYKF